MTRDEIRRRLMDEARDVYDWSNGPGAAYGWHSHPYTKILYCLEGSIVFVTAERRIPLAAGDRLELPAGTSHSAVVGERGVVCAEGKRPA